MDLGAGAEGREQQCALIDSGLVGSTDFHSWEGYHESGRCSRDPYPETYITTCTSIRRLNPSLLHKHRRGEAGKPHGDKKKRAQGYLAHKKQLSPLGPPYEPRYSPIVGS